MSAAEHYALFDSPVGKCGLAWGERGILGVQLPGGRELDTRARLQRQIPGGSEAQPPAEVRRAIELIVALLRGGPSDLSAISLDMARVPPFHRRVYEVARAIVPGATASYGDIAKKLGAPGSARAVGQALGRNPFAIVVPCHRVLAAGGKVGGFSADGGIATKLKLLAIEGAKANGELFDNDGALGFDPAAALEHLRAAEPALGRLFDAVGPFRMQIKHTRSLFAALAEAIVYQQLSGKAASTIYARVCALFPYAHHGPAPERILRTSDARLRGAGLSGSKLLSLRDLARKTLEGAIPTLAEAHRMEDEVLIERLTQVRGIGRWTVEMLLMFRLGRPDILPVDDYGVRKGYALAFRKRDLPVREDLRKRGERWKPYRTAASWYLWRALDLPK